MTPEIIYWDTDAFLGWLQNEAGKVELCAGTLDRAERGEVLIVSSALTIAEVLWRKAAPKITKDKAAILHKFFRRSFIRIRGVSRAIAEEAQMVVWDHGIKPKDAVHVATAIDAKAAILETFDEDLIARSGKVGGLTIRRPIAPAQGKLPYEP